MDQDNAQYRTDPLFRARRIARTRAQHAFNRGDILWSPCPCGSKHPEMHHEDYSKPLEVKWLCRRCHMLEHYGPAPVVTPRPKPVGDPIAELLKRLDARRAPEPPVLIGPAKVSANPAQTRRVA